MNWRNTLRFGITVIAISLLSVSIAEIMAYVSQTMVRSPLKGLENQIVDLAFQARFQNESLDEVTCSDVVIIDIDDSSIEQLGRPQLWPRAYDAFAIDYVASGNPKSIGIDYLYTEADSLSSVYADILDARGFSDSHSIINSLSTDRELARTIGKAGNVYLALYDDEVKAGQIADSSRTEFLRLFEVPGDTTMGFRRITYPVLPIRRFSAQAKGVGAINMRTMQDGTVRNYQLLQEMPHTESTTQLLGNFPLYMLIDELGISDEDVGISPHQVVLNDSLSIPLDGQGAFRINWLGSEDKIRYIPFHKVLSERVPSEFFENKYVFFGTSASGMQDLKTVPSSARLIPGVEVHVIAFLNMMNQAFLLEITEQQAAPWFILLSFVLVSLFLITRPFLGFLLGITLLFGEMFFFILWYLPNKMTVFPIVTFMLITIFCYLITSLYIYFIRERKSRMLKTAFGSYVSPEVVNSIAKESSAVQLGGERKELTVLFSDIRGFTSFSEKLAPESVVEFLNEYLSVMSKCVFRQEGTIDKFIGDAVMAIFGAPIYLEDHAERACRSALDMIRTLEEFNARIKAKGLEPIRIGIGLNSGPMTVGNIGSDLRFDYTVIGDGVNLGSRLESLTSLFRLQIIISEHTYNAIDKEEFEARPIANVVVYGREQPVQIFELRGYSFEKSKDSNSLDIWDKAYAAFMGNDATSAKQLFQEYLDLNPADLPAQHYVKRCDDILANPGSFDPILRMKSK